MNTQETKTPNEATEMTDSEMFEKPTTEDFVSELREPRWSVVSFELRAAKNLTYAEAEQQIARMKKEGISGLCIITDEAAERIAAEK